MDEIYSIDKRVKHRRGFALMITLSVLSVIIALTMVLLSYFQEVQKDASATKALIQANVYYADIVEVFNKFKNKKTLFNVLYESALPLRTADNKFSMVLKCESLNRGVNINWLGIKDSKDPNKVSLKSTADELFEEIAQEYSLEEPDRLYEMILEEVGGKRKFVQKEQSRLHQKNGIISFKQFTSLLSHYQYEVDDTKVMRVPWEKYFSFSKNAEKVDVEYSSAELIAYLFEMDLSLTKEWVSSLEKGSLQNFVNENGGAYESRKNILPGKEFLEEAECFVGYGLADGQYHFKFEYMQGEAKHFEFYGKR
ncbi:MAG: hypothetical protein U9O24_04330 [Campylobacterota bacterium]|nr:hypothetical protein [Campylobacterota bacterium]